MPDRERSQHGSRNNPGKVPANEQSSTISVLRPVRCCATSETIDSSNTIERNVNRLSAQWMPALFSTLNGLTAVFNTSDGAQKYCSAECALYASAAVLPDKYTVKSRRCCNNGQQIPKRQARQHRAARSNSAGLSQPKISYHTSSGMCSMCKTRRMSYNQKLLHEISSQIIHLPHKKKINKKIKK